MGITTVSVGAAEWFTPPGQKKSAQTTDFKIQSLTQTQYLEVVEEFDRVKRKFTARSLMLSLQFGLLDWRNLKDKDGKEVPFSFEALAVVPYTVITDIAVKIITISQLTEDQRKN